jgi:hypothetical protein
VFNIESLIPFVPVLLIIGLRIFMERKKRAAAAEQQVLASMLEASATEEPEPSTTPQKRLFRREQSDLNGKVLATAPEPAPLKDMRKPVPGKEKKRATRLASLPPLKGGVVWAEILGPPKGL